MPNRGSNCGVSLANWAGLAFIVLGIYLIQFDKLKDSEDHPLLPMELYTVEELSEVCENCGQKLANLFKGRADMERYLAILVAGVASVAIIINAVFLQSDRGTYEPEPLVTKLQKTHDEIRT